MKLFKTCKGRVETFKHSLDLGVAMGISLKQAAHLINQTHYTNHLFVCSALNSPEYAEELLPVYCVFGMWGSFPLLSFFVIPTDISQSWSAMLLWTQKLLVLMCLCVSPGIFLHSLPFVSSTCALCLEKGMFTQHSEAEKGLSIAEVYSIDVCVKGAIQV